MKNCSLKRLQYDISAAWKTAMGECIIKRVQHEKSTREKRYNMKRVRHGRVQCEKFAVRGKAAAKKGTMKRVKQKTVQKCRFKLKNVQHEKLQHEKSAIEEYMQKKRRCNMKRAQHERRCNMKRL